MLKREGGRGDVDLEEDWARESARRASMAERESSRRASLL